ncbi:MAG TPA: phophatidylserine decarboxylase associated domain-containing protein [Isosphaeraceae bacterium]|jgi:hypothetical protein
MNATRPKTSLSLTSRLGGWLPADPTALNRWLAETIAEAEQKRAPVHPVIEEFRDLIEGDPVLFMYFTQMFEQQPRIAPPLRGDVRIRDYHQRPPALPRGRPRPAEGMVVGEPFAPRISRDRALDAYPRHWHTPLPAGGTCHRLAVIHERGGYGDEDGNEVEGDRSRCPDRPGSLDGPGPRR